VLNEREGKRPLGRPRFRWGIILRWIFRKWEVVVGTGSSWLRIWRGGEELVTTVMNFSGSMICGEFLD
jgi:hypothetical protein